MVSRHDRRDGELSDRCRRLSASRDDDDYVAHGLNVAVGVLLYSLQLLYPIQIQDINGHKVLQTIVLFDDPHRAILSAEG